MTYYAKPTRMTYNFQRYSKLCIWCTLLVSCESTWEDVWMMVNSCTTERHSLSWRLLVGQYMYKNEAAFHSLSQINSYIFILEYGHRTCLLTWLTNKKLYSASVKIKRIIAQPLSAIYGINVSWITFLKPRSFGGPFHIFHGRLDGFFLCSPSN